MTLIVEYTSAEMAKADYNNLRLMDGMDKPSLNLDGNIMTLTYAKAEDLLNVIRTIAACVLMPGERMASIKVVGPNISTKLITNLHGR